MASAVLPATRVVEEGLFQVLVTEPVDAQWNLALEQELLREVQAGSRPDTVRLWVNDECLVRGLHENRRFGGYDERLARELGVRVYTRNTGGGCVYHDRGNLNWSFYVRSTEGFVGSMKLFQWSSGFIIEALQTLGLDATFGCPNRIDVAGKKVSGQAARATSRASLVHGTLLVSSDLERLRALCIPPPDCPPVARLRDFDPRLSVTEVTRAIVGVLAAARPGQATRTR